MAGIAHQGQRTEQPAAEQFNDRKCERDAKSCYQCAGTEPVAGQFAMSRMGMAAVKMRTVLIIRAIVTVHGRQATGFEAFASSAAMLPRACR